jgi:hypothetical protein
VTCVELPEPDADEVALTEAVRALGVDARVAAWDDQDVDWASFDAAVIRSTWNYHHRAADFLSWCEHAATVTHLYNGLETIRWNAHKSYLRELDAVGIPTTPTYWCEAGDAIDLELVVAATGWSRIVVKPAVSAGSFATVTADADSLGPAAAHAEGLLSGGRDVMVQQYLESVEDYGERSLVWVDGALRHCVRKSARFAGQHESVSTQAIAIADDEAALAEQVLDHAGREGLLYARIDLARDTDDFPVLMELELIEPSLFLVQHPPTLDTFARAIAAL